jgi:cytochrome P450
VIKESLRLSALLVSRLPLVAPTETLRYKSHAIPPGTEISMSIPDILHDPSIFSSPHEFLPERWLPGNPDLARLNRFWVPFGRGSRICLGLNLAMAEMYMVIGCMFRRFEFELFETGEERDIKVHKDCFAAEVRRESPGVRVQARCVDGYRVRSAGAEGKVTTRCPY